jgi:1-acyl-sn-glycerol-3-phosphate acyltransferase
VSNHPLGGQDGIALGSIICHKYDSRMVYLVNDILMSFKGLAPLCVPINKTGRNSRNFPKMVEMAFQSPKNVVMFPAGLCSRKQNGVICDIPWSKTFISKSVEYQRDVVPIHFSGQNSKFFYRLANFSDKCLPFNLAMLFLVDEMYKNVHKTFQISIGKPIPWQTFDKSKTPMEWAQFVKDQVYKL